MTTINKEFELAVEAHQLASKLLEMRKAIREVNGLCAWEVRSARLYARMERLDALYSKAHRRYERRDAAYEQSDLGKELRAYRKQRDAVVSNAA